MPTNVNELLVFILFFIYIVSLNFTLWGVGDTRAKMYTTNDGG